MMQLLRFVPVSLKNLALQRVSERFYFTSQSGRFQIVLDGNQRVVEFIIDAYSYPEVVDMINESLRETEQSIVSQIQEILTK